MNPVAVNEEIASVISMPGLQVFPHPADSISPPTAEIALPDIDYDQAFQKGLVRMRSRIILSVSSTFDEAAFTELAKYIEPADATHSIHARLHNRTVAQEWTTCSFARVVRGFGVDHYFGETRFMAYQFDLDIAGTGT